MREFFLDLASNPKIRHRFHISRVEVGDTWAAANFAILFGDRYYHVLASYEDDAAVSHYGPGALHLRELLAHAIKLGMRRFDFTIGDEPYKDEWSDTSVKLYDHSAAATWRGWPASAESTARRRLKRFVKQTPSLWKLVSRLRATVGALTHPKASPQQLSTTSRAAKAQLQQALACVMGDMDLLRPIAAAGISCAVVTRPGLPSLYSRFASARLPWDDFSQNTGALLDALEHFGGTQREQPVLFMKKMRSFCLFRATVNGWQNRFASSSPTQRWSKTCSTRRGSRTWRSATACRCRRRASFIPSPSSPTISILLSPSSSSR